MCPKSNTQNLRVQARQTRKTRHRSNRDAAFAAIRKTNAPQAAPPTTTARPSPTAPDAAVTIPSATVATDAQ